MQSRTTYFPMETMIKLWFCRLRYFFEVYIEQFWLLIGSRQLTTELLNSRISSGRFLVTGRERSSQYCNKGFDHNKGAGSGFFIIATGAEPSQVSVFHGPHKHMQLITIHAEQVFIRHGYLQNAGAGLVRYLVHPLSYVPHISQKKGAG